MKPYVITGPVARAAICKKVMEAPEGSVVVFRDSNRTLGQNAADGSACPITPEITGR